MCKSNPHDGIRTVAGKISVFCHKEDTVENKKKDRLDELYNAALDCGLWALQGAKYGCWIGGLTLTWAASNKLVSVVFKLK